MLFDTNSQPLVPGILYQMITHEGMAYNSFSIYEWDKMSDNERMNHVVRATHEEIKTPITIMFCKVYEINKGRYYKYHEMKILYENRILYSYWKPKDYERQIFSFKRLT